MRWRCGDCKGSLDKHRIAPMLQDELWHTVARGRARLCNACLRNRMRRVLGRDLRFADLTVCRINVLTGHCHELSLPGKQRTDYALAVLDFERDHAARIAKLADQIERKR